MQETGHRQVEHQITINAPAAEIYRLIAEVENWPMLFPPTIFVDRVDLSESAERIRIWATANGEVKNWTSRRVLDPQARRIEFRAEVFTPPVASMGGTWLIEPTADGQSLVRLLHDYRAVDDDPEGLHWISQAVDRNSKSELAALKANVELASGAEELMFSFADTVQINGSAKDVYDFLNEAQLWRERLPHVQRVVLTEESPGLQTLEMDTRTKDGGVHTTKSVRVCFPHSKIVYKQITLPALMTLHTGCWTVVEEADGGLSVTSQHTVVINPANVSLLGADAGVAEARDFVHRALSGNSLATLGKAKEYAESRRS
ncbi:MAG: aromatase/cyclase [Jatrophihabitantaceae bacterium]